VKSGNITEVYTYEKIPKLKNRVLNDILSNGVKEDRIEEYIKTSQYVSRETIRRYAINNFSNKDLFITLTFRENTDNHDYCNKQFKQFIQRLKLQAIKLNVDLKYISVIEYQERGAIHYHMLTNFPSKLIKGCGYIVRNKYFEDRFWKNGFVFIKDIKNLDNVGAYLVKYIIKDITTIPNKKDKRRYLKSNNLIKSEEFSTFGENLTTENLQEYIKDLSPNYLVYTSEYENEFWGKITYKEYNLERPYI
jgi:hypothetical protein